MTAVETTSAHPPPRRNPWTDADVERHWDAVARIYGRENERVRETHDQRFAVAVPWLKLFPGARVLNISSRDAGAEAPLREACPDLSITHAEVSAGLLEVALERHPEAVMRKLEGYASLPFADRVFDRVLSLETLEHVADPLAFLSELHRVTRAGGLLVLSCPPATAEPAYRLYTAVCGGHGEGPHRFLPSREVRELLAAARWELDWHRGTLLLPVGPRWLRHGAERLLARFPDGMLAEFGIRQFYVARRA